jgi:ribosomal protein S18 acetylase RimI-like enzyme
MRKDASDADREVHAIERAAFAAWPADEVVAEGGWRLRHLAGVTNRGNSVWPGPGSGGERALEDRIVAVERFYAERGLPPRYQLSPIAAPATLDAELEGRGYERYAPVRVCTASADAVPDAAAASVEAEVASSLAPDWWELSGERGRYDVAQREAYRRLLQRIEERAGFAIARIGGRTAGVGLAVLGEGRAGIFSMRTDMELRRRGVGAAIVTAIARWARSRGAPALYLQVEEDNPAATALYKRMGFSTAYRYHYRWHPPRP